VVVGLKGLDAKMNWLAVYHQLWSNFDYDFECSVESQAVKRKFYVCCIYSDIWSV
jgi:hypothetical protein